MAVTRRGNGKGAPRAGLGDSGQAVVEFALVAPIFILLLVGLAEFARAWNVYHVLTDAARTGARMAVVANPLVDADSVRTVIVEAMRSAALNPAQATIQINGISAFTGGDTQVEIVYRHRFLLLSTAQRIWTGDPDVTIISAATMRHE